MKSFKSQWLNNAGIYVLFLAVTIFFFAMLVVITVSTTTRWKSSSQIGAATVLSFMYLGFCMHFYLQNFTTRV